MFKLRSSHAIASFIVLTMSVVQAQQQRPQGPGGAIPPVLESGLTSTAQLRAADEQINRKWSEVRNAAGEPRVPGPEGVLKIGAGYYRQYANGRIYYRPGYQPLHVYGYIGEKYTQLGGPQSWLGWPTSDEQDFPEGGRTSTFEHGAIYWWRDTGAIEMGDIIVRYTGLFCFGETDNDQLSSSDEPYVIFGVIPPPRINNGKATVETSAPRTKIYEGVDAGESREDSIELYRGLPYGMSISATLMEHDFSDPDEYRGIVKAAADKGAEGIVMAAEKVPSVGPALAVVAGAVWKAIGDDVVGEIHGLLDTKDDNVDTKPFVITAKQMVTLARAKRQNKSGIQWHLDSPLLSGDGSSYKVYFVIEEIETALAKSTPPPAPVWRDWFRITNGGGLKAPITPLLPRPGHIDLFVVGNDGGIYSTFIEDQRGWRNWFPIRELRVPTQSPVTAFARPGHIDLFVVGSDGGVYSTFKEENQVEWQKWFRIGYVGVAPRGNVAVVQPRPGHIDLFVVGSDAKVYSTFHEGNRDWVPWFPIWEMRSPPGSEITALLSRPGHIDLFVSGTEGGVYSTFFEGNGPWQPWSRIPGVDMLPGSPITALALPTARVALFVVGKDKRILSTYRLGATAWQGWLPVAEGGAKPGTRVAALDTRPGHTDLFVVGTDGGIYSTYIDGNDWQWKPWFRVTNMVSTSGTTVSALQPRPGHIDLFAPGLDSGVYSTFYEAGLERTGTTSSALKTSPAPEPVKAQGRVTLPPGTPASPPVSICERARVARERNSPAAPGLEQSCLAAKGEAIANQDPLAVRLRNQQPNDSARRGFHIGIAITGEDTLPGPGKDRVCASLPPAELGGCRIGVSFAIERNRRR